MEHMNAPSSQQSYHRGKQVDSAPNLGGAFHMTLVARFSFLNNSIPTISASLYKLIIHSLVNDSPLSNRNDGILLTHGTCLDPSM
jgi:hypothetical protein